MLVLNTVGIREYLKQFPYELYYDDIDDRFIFASTDRFVIDKLSAYIEKKRDKCPSCYIKDGKNYNRVLPMCWKYRRLLWLGHRERESVLSWLPKDLIRLIGKIGEYKYCAETIILNFYTNCKRVWNYEDDDVYDSSDSNNSNDDSNDSNDSNDSSDDQKCFLVFNETDECEFEKLKSIE